MAEPASPNTYRIDSVTPDDARGLAAANMTAFHQYPRWTSLWPVKPLSEIIDDMACRIPWNFVDGVPLKRYQKAVDRSSGEIVGYVRYNLPKGMENSWKEADVPVFNEATKAIFKARYESVLEDGKIRGMDHALAEMSGSPIDEAEEEVEKLYGEEQLMALEYLAVHPNHQRRGVAGMLLIDGLRFADENGLSIMVTAWAQAVTIYQRHGFKQTKLIPWRGAEIAQGSESQDVTIMIREPVRHGQSERG